MLLSFKCPRSHFDIEENLKLPRTALFFYSKSPIYSARHLELYTFYTVIAEYTDIFANVEHEHYRSLFGNYLDTS